jgi:hypothetical protein
VQSILIILLVAVLGSGCATNTEIYYWGSYEKLIYTMYNKPGSADPGLQIITLTQDIQKAQEKGKRVPPGVHAHLGFMYAIQGNVEQSQAAFLQEKLLFPESAIFIDGMMARALKSAAQ